MQILSFSDIKHKGYCNYFTPWNRTTRGGWDDLHGPNTPSVVADSIYVHIINNIPRHFSYESFDAFSRWDHNASRLNIKILDECCEFEVLFMKRLTFVPFFWYLRCHVAHDSRGIFGAISHNTRLDCYSGKSPIKGTSTSSTPPLCSIPTRIGTPFS